MKNVTLKIQGGERVGVCGRTGSGKTSLLLALFRMLRIEGAGPPAPIPPDDPSILIVPVIPILILIVSSGVLGCAR